MQEIPSRFRRAIGLVKALGQHPRYQGAFIFGSVAEGLTNANSDLDVKVLVDVDNSCRNVNHPHLDGIKLDLSFLSVGQLEKQMNEELNDSWNRSPNLASAIILFDKTGKLAELKRKAASKKPARYNKKDYQWVQFMLYHANDKVERPLKDDPVASLYSMHANIGEVLKLHYRLHGRWWLSSKNIVSDLRAWDGPLAQMVSRFVSTSEAEAKYVEWTHILAHVAKTIGGRQPIQQNNCDCTVCHQDLAALSRD